MKTAIKIAVIAALAATADVSVATAASPSALASSAQALHVDTQVEKVQRRVVRRRPYWQDGRRWGRDYGYWRPRSRYYRYPYYYHDDDAGAALAAGIIGFAAGAALGAVAGDPSYRVYDDYPVRRAPLTRSPTTPTGCYYGAGDRLECPRY